MDNLVQRFATLDHVEVPELWPDIQRRAEAGAAVPVTGSTVGWGRAGARPLPNLVRLAAIVGALIATLAIGAFIGGQLLQQRNAPIVPSPSVAPTPEPSPAANERCAQMQQAATRTAVDWPTGAAPNATPQNGWIAAWNGSETPAVELVDPETGQVCELIVFGDRVTPLGVPTEAGPRDWIPTRGKLAWSPNGEALAIEVVSIVNEQPPGHDLYVWSADGLLGPIAWPETPRTIDGIAWSPDGSWIAATDTSHSVMPTGEASILIAAADGARYVIPLECGRPCWGDPPLVSPDGRHIATRVRGMDELSGGQFSPWEEVGVVDVASGEVQHLENSAELLARRDLVGWAGPGELLMMEADSYQIGVPIDSPTETISYGRDQLPPQVSADGLGLSPDKSLRIHVVESRTGAGGLAVGAWPTSRLPLSIADLDSASGATWWSPDSSLIGYLIDVQTDNQGIWTIEPDGDGQRLLASGAFVIDSESRNVWQPVWP